MNREHLTKYAELVIRQGVNIQPGQKLVIATTPENAPLLRLLAEKAYDAGASEVIADYHDDPLRRMFYLRAADECFDHYPDYKKQYYETLSKEGAAFINIADTDPELMNGVDADRMSRQFKVASEALEAYRERRMNNENTWCIIAAPSEGWARKVFPNVPGEEAVEKLWAAIFAATRADLSDPVAAWQAHKDTLQEKVAILNELKIETLHYRNGLGTDLKIELPEGYLFLGGADESTSGTEFIANIPTEEVFTLPHREGVEGIVYASMPLNFRGNLIDGFWLRFEQGRVVDYDASVGKDHLQKLLESDEGAARLGEVALVPHDSPISNTGILFYNTLFDENASCHLALGRAYPMCLENHDQLDAEEKLARGVNHSIVHEDFMIGTADLDIVAKTRDGREVKIFEKGNFAI